MTPHKIDRVFVRRGNHKLKQLTSAQSMALIALLAAQFPPTHVLNMPRDFRARNRMLRKLDREIPINLRRYVRDVAVMYSKEAKWFNAPKGISWAKLPKN